MFVFPRGEELCRLEAECMSSCVWCSVMTCRRSNCSGKSASFLESSPSRCSCTTLRCVSGRAGNQVNGRLRTHASAWACTTCSPQQAAPTALFSFVSSACSPVLLQASPTDHTRPLRARCHLPPRTLLAMKLPGDLDCNLPVAGTHTDNEARGRAGPGQRMLPTLRLVGPRSTVIPSPPARYT